MNAVGRRLSESRVRENLMHGLRWQAMEMENTAPLPDPTRIRPVVGRIQPMARVSRVTANLKEAGGKTLV